MRFHLPAHFLQRLAEKFLDFAAAQADDVRVLLLQAGFVIVLVAAVVHQVQLVHQAALLEQLQRAVDGDAIELGILLLGQLKQAFGVQVAAGLVDQVEQHAALARQPHAALAQGILNAGVGHGWFQGSKKK